MALQTSRITCIRYFQIRQLWFNCSESSRRAVSTLSQNCDQEEEEIEEESYDSFSTRTVKNCTFIPPVMNKSNVKTFPSVKDVVRWCETEPLHQVLPALDKLHQQGMPMTREMLYSIVQTSVKTRNVTAAKSVFSLVVNYKLNLVSSIGDQLIRFFAFHGCMTEANAVFQRISSPTVHTWHSIIHGHSVRGKENEALHLYNRMRQEDAVKPNAYILSSILKACSSLKHLQLGLWIHNDIIELGLESDVVIGTALIDMYFKCNMFEQASNLFQNLANKNVVSWNTMLSGYIQQRQYVSAMRWFQKMLKDGVLPDRVTFLTAMKACSNLGLLEESNLIHELIIQSDLISDSTVRNSLINMHAKCGNLGKAYEIFESMQVRDGVSWSSMISGYLSHGYGFTALELFQEMQEDGIRPDKVTILHALKACGVLRASSQTRMLNDQLIRNGLVSDVMVANTVIDTYAKCGSVEEADRVFKILPERSIVSWNALLSAYSQNQADLPVLELFDRMQLDGFAPTAVSFSCVVKACGNIGELKMGQLIHDQIVKQQLETDPVVGNTLIDMYMKCGRLYDANKTFLDMLNPNIVSWGAIITGYIEHDDAVSALISFQQMLERNIEPDLVIILSILKACGSMGVMNWGKQIHDYVIRNGLECDLGVGSGLTDMYAKCGSLREAEHLFRTLTHRNVISWNAMIAGYSQHEHAELAVEWFEDMQLHGMIPTSSTFTSILAACAHTGQVEDGYRYFKSMSNTYNIQPRVEHFNCMVDILGHAGRLSDAEGMLNSIPNIPDINGWMSLLTSCTYFGDVRLGKRCLEQIEKLNPETSAGHVLMLNIYVDAQMWEEAEKMHKMWRSIDSWSEVDTETHDLTVGDQGHPESDGIVSQFQGYSESATLEEKGYISNSELYLEPLPDRTRKFYEHQEEG